MNTSLLISGGHTGSAYSNATEEFTLESTAARAEKQLTSTNNSYKYKHIIGI